MRFAMLRNCPAYRRSQRTKEEVLWWSVESLGKGRSRTRMHVLHVSVTRRRTEREREKEREFAQPVPIWPESFYRAFSVRSST